MEASGRNLTPDRLQKHEKLQLASVCDAALIETVRHLKPKYVLGIGGFAAKRAEIALAGLPPKLGTLLHPSPASPKANRGWAKAVEEQLCNYAIDIP